MTETVFHLPDAAGCYPGQGEVYLCIPEGREALPAVLALHGSGREALSYRDVPFYRAQRDLALSCGFLFAALSNGPDTFGQTAGAENIKGLHSLLIARCRIRPRAALWASSAGGLTMHRYLREAPERVGLLLGVFPIFDPLTQPAIPSFMKAYHAQNEAQLRAQTAFLSPQPLFSACYSGITAAVAHGREDRTVPIAQSYAMCRYIRHSGGRMLLHECAGGHSTENFALYETPIFREALLTFRDKV